MPPPSYTLPMPGELHYSDRSSRADEHMDEFCFYSEIRALYAICRVHSVTDDDGMLRIELELCAVANRSRAFEDPLPEGTIEDPPPPHSAQPKETSSSAVRVSSAPRAMPRWPSGT